MKPAASSCRRSLIAVLGLACVMAWPASAAPAQPRLDVHGALDAYAGHGVAMAWAVLRGKDEATTFVVVRVDADTERYRALVVTGMDPFTSKGEPLAPETRLDRSVVVRLARSRFADLPQTEWRFLPNDPAGQTLVVDYRGVPDTTPEFDDPAKLDASLARRLEQARRASGGAK